MDARTDFVDQIRAALLPLADAQRAPAMRAYMRDRFDFLGIAAPVRRAAVLAIGHSLKGMPGDQLIDIADALWALPEREYHQAAIDLLARHWKSLTPAHIPALLALARRNAWWDSVDGLAGVVGDVLHAADRREQVQMDAALHDGDFWIRRIAMLHQLGWRAETDTARLFGYARQLAPETEFFIRKAIGWALRDYAWHAPAVVGRFLDEEGERLSPLTRREAAKNLGRLLPG